MRSIIKWLALAIAIVAVVVAARLLPLDRVGEALEAWIADLGVWGSLAFVLIYILAVVLILPAWTLTVAAGAIFGLALGTALVSLGSTAGAAFAFLISRYLARRRIEAKIRNYPRFEAIDSAIGEGGWRVVALLRLSPVVPFNLQNYLYGLTKIRFWPCVLTSWLAMLPGTFMYVYLGYLGRSGVEAAGGGQAASTGQWILRGVGLAATVAVTVYVSRLARKALSEGAGLDRGDEETRLPIAAPHNGQKVNS